MTYSVNLGRQPNLTYVPAEWMDPEATRAAVDRLSAPELRDTVLRYGQPVPVGSKAATKEVNHARLVRLFDDEQNKDLLAAI